MPTQVEHVRSIRENSPRPATKRPPGPRGLFGLNVVQRFRTAPLPFLMELHKDYGDIVYSRMGPFRGFFFFHPDQIREVLTDKARLLPKFRPQVRVLQHPACAG